MIPIFICEDDSLQKSVIESIIYKKILIEEYDMKIELSTADPYELKKYIDSRDSIGGVYFLDIDFNTDINGIQLASYIRKKDINAKIIFITTHSELLQLTFEYRVEALDYIMKDNVTLIQQKIFDCLENAYSYYTSDKNEDMDKVKFKIGNTVKLLSLDDIMFIETTGTPHKLNIHLKNGSFELYETLSEIEKLSPFFVRVHNSVIVNKNNIDYIDKKNKVAVMTNGESCILSVRGIKKII